MTNLTFLADRTGGLLQALFGPLGFGLVVAAAIFGAATLIISATRRHEGPTREEMAFEEYRKQVWTELASRLVDEEIARRAYARATPTAPVTQPAPESRPALANASYDLNHAL